MNYLPLNEFKKAWVFRHQDLEIAPTDLEKIKLMSPTRSAVLWSTMVSREKDHPDFFTENEWAGQASSWQENLNWEKDWEAGLEELPESINEFLKWENNTTVYFCLNRDCVIETQFDVFKRCWQNFMFLADGCLLLGKKRDTVAQFLENGDVKLGNKPKG